MARPAAIDARSDPTPTSPSLGRALTAQGSSHCKLSPSAPAHGPHRPSVYIPGPHRSCLGRKNQRQTCARSSAGIDGAPRRCRARVQRRAGWWRHGRHRTYVPSAYRATALHLHPPHASARSHCCRCRLDPSTAPSSWSAWSAGGCWSLRRPWSTSNWRACRSRAGRCAGGGGAPAHAHACSKQAGGCTFSPRPHHIPTTSPPRTPALHVGGARHSAAGRGGADAAGAAQRARPRRHRRRVPRQRPAAGLRAQGCW